MGSLVLTLTGTTINNISLFGEYSKTGIDYLTSQGISSSQLQIRFYYRPPSSLPAGTYSDTAFISVCLDANCTHEAAGSPLTVQSTYTVTGPVDPLSIPLVPRSRVTLSHNVLDAEYSRSLDRIVMVASYPTNALYVYDVNSGAEMSVPLHKTPAAVSLSPDGLTAAVGHDAMISVINLNDIGQSAPVVPVLLNVAADVYDLVLDGHGDVHVFPRVDQWVNPRSVDIATNVETVGSFGLRAGSRARLHPGGNHIYSADNGLSPSDIRKWDITSGAAISMYDSPYHGDYGMCGDLWFNESGSRIYTRCGNSFSSNAARAEDMLYTGKFALSTNTTYSTSYGVAFMDHHAGRNEIALIESSQPYGCGTGAPSDPCFTHLGTFDGGFLTQKSLFSIAPITIEGSRYDQRGLFVFYKADGTSKFLLSRLVGMPSPAAEYYLSVVD